MGWRTFPSWIDGQMSEPVNVRSIRMFVRGRERHLGGNVDGAAVRQACLGPRP